MPIPPLPDEIIGKIIGFNLKTFSGESEYELRQDRLYSLLGPQAYGMVSKSWQIRARREAFRYIDLSISEEKGAVILRKLSEKSMSGTKYAKLVQKLWTTQDDVPGRDQSLASIDVWIHGPQLEEKLAASDRVKTVLKTCTRLREVCMDYVDAEALRLLSQLPELHSLHLDGPIGLLGNSTHQFHSLRHLTINSTKLFSLSPRNFEDQKHNFFLPSYFPSLESLSLSNIPLNFPEFFESFLKCAPRLKSLFLSNLILFEFNTETGFWRMFSPEETVEVLCTEVVPACRTLKNLGLFFKVTESKAYFKYSSSFPPSTETIYFGFYGSMDLMFNEVLRRDLKVNGLSKIFLTRFGGSGPDDESASRLEGVFSWARDRGVELEEVNYEDHYITGPNRSIRFDEVFELRIWNAIHLS